MPDEQRSTPRFLHQLYVDIDGLELPTTNVSLQGAQLSCPAMRFGSLKSAGQNGGLTIDIPLRPESVKVAAEISYANESDDGFLVGVTFKQFLEDSESRWREFIEWCGEHAVARSG